MWSVAVFGLFGLLFVASPVSAQDAVTGGAFVQVPAVSELDVEAGGSSVVATSSGVERSGVFRIRVRANHSWKVVLTAPVGAGGTVWVRASGDVEYRPLEPGMETVVASGERGEAVIAVDYRLEGDSVTEVAAVPLTYTLGSL